MFRLLSAVSNFLVRFKSTRWDPLSRSHKRLLVLSTLLSFGTLGVAEWYLWFYGSTPDFLQFELYPGKGVSYSTRQTTFFFRVLLLTLWGWYVFYQLQVKPVWSTATSTYQELRKTLPVSLATLRAFCVSPEFGRLVRGVLAVGFAFITARGGVLTAVLLLLSLLILSFVSCYSEFKAGHYPGSEQEFWEEISSGGNKVLRITGQSIAAAGTLVAAAGIFLGVYKVNTEWKIFERQQQMEERKLVDKADERALKREELAEIAKQRDFKERKLAFKIEQEAKQSTPKKGGWF